MTVQDGTLAVQKSTLQFPRDADDWVLYNKKVPEKLKELESQGFTVVIFRQLVYRYNFVVFTMYTSRLYAVLIYLPQIGWNFHLSSSFNGH